METRSALVVRNGRPDKGMPALTFSDRQIAGLVAFIHTQQNAVPAKKGGRKGVDVSDLQTGNVEAGKKYFDGSGRMRHLPFADRRSCRDRIALTRASSSRSRCCIRNTRNPKSR